MTAIVAMDSGRACLARIRNDDGERVADGNDPRPAPGIMSRIDALTASIDTRSGMVPALARAQALALQLNQCAVATIAAAN